MPQIDVAKACKIVGEKLRAVRETTEKSIDKAATEAGITPDTLSRIENGEVEFHLLTLLRLCEVYHTPPAKLLGDFSVGPPK